MGEYINFKAYLNKKNGQLNLSVPKKKLPESLRKILRDNPEKLKSFKMMYEDCDLW